MNINIIELNKKIDEYFCDPTWKTDKYRQLYFRNNKNISVPLNQISQSSFYKEVKFSPLYNAIRETFFCLGINPETGGSLKSKRDFGPANIAAALLEGIICEVLTNVKYMKLSNNSTPTQRENFNQNYLKIGKCSATGIRLLRNAIAHVNYGLMVFPGSYNPFNKKVFFNLKRTVKFPIRRVKNTRNYPTVNFVVNPEILLERIIKASQKLKREIRSQKNPNLSKWFLEKIKRKHWINY